MSMYISMYCVCVCFVNLYIHILYTVTISLQILSLCNTRSFHSILFHSCNMHWIIILLF